jgi:tetratricopeptide (TPR) repeat protein/predicted Ser/Thr protein kinase
MPACPSEDELSGFVGGRLSRARRGEVEGHLDGCRGCLGTVARIASALVQRGARASPIALEATMLSPDAGPPRLDSSVDSSRPATLKLEPGASAGRYRILRKLGAGGMGTVYLADDPALERKVAIKVLRSDRAAALDAVIAAVVLSGSLRARLLREAHAMARLSHRNVVAVHDVGLFDDDVFIVMEYIDGVTLREWLAGPRSRDERLRVLADAGRGLVAAHAAGLVHRDFKPDNVLMADARPLVCDFGLAQRLERGGNGDGDPAFAGTPAYMAPEQLRGGDASVASDAFSFAVTLYEAMEGERPFAGQTVREHRDNVLANRMRPFRRATPRWLKRLILHALASDPTARPSMAWIVERIDRHVTRRPVWLVAAAAAAIVAVVGASALLRPVLECRGVARRLNGIWDANVKHEVRAAFLASGARLADERYNAVARVLDDHARAWAELDQQVCTATRVRHEQSDELYDLRMVCLGQRLQELAAFTDLLRHADASMVAEAANGATRLARLDECSDVIALQGPVRAPKDPALRRRIDEARSHIARAKALELGGRYAAAQAAASGAVDQARAIGYAPLEAEALLELATVEKLSGHYGESERIYQAASEAADRGRDDAVRVAAASDMVEVAGVYQPHHAEAHRWARQAAAILERLDDNRGEPAATLAMNVGLLANAEGQLDEAERQLRSTLALWEKLQPPNPRAVATALYALAKVVDNRGKHEQAIELGRRAAAFFESTLGPHHPMLANVLHNIGVAQARLSHYREALASYERALAIHEATLEPDHPDVIGALINLASIHVYLGEQQEAVAIYERALPGARKGGPVLEALLDFDFAEAKAELGDAARALELGRRALELRRQALGPGDFATGRAALMVGVQLLNLRRLAEAEPYLVEAQQVIVRARGPEDEALGEVYDVLGDLRLAQKRAGDAVQAFERARAIKVARLGADNLALAPSLRGIGRAWLELRNPERARAPLESALELESSAKAAEEDRALSSYLLAQALWDTRHDRPRARQLAAEAMAIYARYPADQDEAARARTWLAGHK